MRKYKWTDVLNVIVNICVLAVLLFVLVRPGNPVGDILAERTREAALRTVITERWDDLTATGARLHAGSGRYLVVMFSDYQCPACRQAHFDVARITSETQIGIVLRHLPLTAIHAAAEGAARASICAESLGHFTNMHDRLFQTTQWHDTSDWLREAVAATIVDTATFNTCLQSASTTMRLQQDLDLARQLGVAATPTFVGPGGVHIGIPTKADLIRISGYRADAVQNPLIESQGE